MTANSRLTLLPRSRRAALILWALGTFPALAQADSNHALPEPLALAAQVGPEFPALPKLGESEASEPGDVGNKQATKPASGGERSQPADPANDALDNSFASVGRLSVENPFSIKNLVQWALDHGPKLIGILIGTLALYVFIRKSGKHLVKIVAAGGSRGSLRERENRALTLVGVFQNVASLVVIGGGVLMLLQELGIPILPLMGGAAVLGLAVAFGAQNLIKDYFTGFMVLLEDQYGINDVIKIGDTSGAVEQITLRVTALRDLEGTLHFIPNGTINQVSNMTHGWSRALIDIGVAYKEDTDRVCEVMLQVASELRQDHEFGPLVVDDAEMLGVDGLGDSAVSIKMVIKTQPLKRWAVRREYLRRIKHRFDELSIEIPFPHRTVFLRQDGTEEAEPRAKTAS